MSQSNPFPWHVLMVFGIRILHLSPNEFWAMSPRELGILMADINPQSEALPLHAMLDMMQQYPDKSFEKP